MTHSKWHIANGTSNMAYLKTCLKCPISNAPSQMPHLKCPISNALSQMPYFKCLITNDVSQMSGLK